MPECESWRKVNSEGRLRRWREADKGAPRAHRLRRVRGSYPLTNEEYKSLWLEQGGVCAVCGRVPNAPLVQDHDHETRVVRGLLCHACNSGIGKLGDSIEGLQRAIAYLEKSNGRDRIGPAYAIPSSNTLSKNGSRQANRIVSDAGDRHFFCLSCGASFVEGVGPVLVHICR